MHAGHVLLDLEGRIVGMDAAFCEIMRASSDELEGQRVLDVTAPADRAECGIAIRNLRNTAKPFSITKRLSRGDGTLVWVVNTVSLTTSSAGEAMIVATIEPVQPPADRGPAVLLDKARGLALARRNQKMVSDRGLFSNPAWEVILAAYVAEAEGRAIDAQGFAGLLDVSLAMVTRWIGVLVHYDVLQVEVRNPVADAPKAFSLSVETHRRLEEYLANLP